MSLKRIWTPSGNYSGGAAKRLLVIHSMEGFTGPNGAYDCAKYFQGNVGASSQVCVDNNRGTIWECVTRVYGSWTQCNYNSVSISMEQSGYASWSRDYWLNNRGNQLENVAEWLAEESAKTGIPLYETNSNGRGVIYHSGLGYDGCNHNDPGNGWPLDVVLQMARGETQPIAEDIDVSAAVAYWNEEPYFACIGKDNNNIFFKGPRDDDFHTVDPGSNAKSGVTLAISPEGRKSISYTNGSNAVCEYYTDVDSNVWVWRAVGGQAK